MRDDSKFGGLAPIELCPRFCRELVELARFRIRLDLSIPSLAVIVREPGPKFSEFLESEILNFALQRLNLCHDRHDYNFGRGAHADMSVEKLPR